MSVTTSIAWCDSTFNPWIGCARISPGCDHCYAAVSTPARAFKVVWGVGEQRRRTSVGNWREPRRWNAGHDSGRRRRVFCASLADVFDNAVPDQWRADLWTLIRETPNLDWLILTKRIGNARAMLPTDWGDGYRNVWLGATVVDQGEADRDVPKLLRVPATIRFLSCEPLLGPVTLPAAVDWVIVGGESGPHARPMQPEWESALRDQCAALEVPYFFKQWGGTARDKGGCVVAGVEPKAFPARRSEFDVVDEKAAP